MRDANSAERSPANTRCVWLSTKPGSTHRPPASIRWSAAGARPVPTATIDAPSNTTWASVSVPSAPSLTTADGGVVRHQDADVVEHGRRHTASAARASSAATSMRTWAPSRTITSPPTTTWSTSAADGREHDRLEQVLAAGAGQPHRIEPHRAQVGQRTRLEPPGLRPAEAGVAVGGGGPQQARRVVVAAHEARQPFVVLHRPRLLEQVDHGVRVGAEGERRSGVAQRPRRADPVGEVALGRRAQAHRRPAGAERVDVGVGEVGRVDGGEALAEQTVPVEQADGCDAVRGDALLVLGRLLGDVAVQRGVALGGPRADDLGRRRIDRPHGVDRGADAGRRRRQPVEVRRAGRPPERIAVAEASLDRIQLDPDAAVQVTGVEQRDANAGRRGGVDQRRAHRVRIVIRHPTARHGGRSGTRRRT